MRQSLPSRTSVIHNGPHPSCTPYPETTADAQAARLLGRRSGFATRTIGPINPTDTRFYNRQLKPFAYDTAKAQALLQAVMPWLTEALRESTSRLRHGPEGAAPAPDRIS